MYYRLLRIDSIGYDEVEGMIVSATSVDEARQIASENAMDEGSHCWLDISKTSCFKLPEVPEPGVLLVARRDG